MPDTSPFEQIEAIYRGAPIGLCVLDRELRYVRVNDRLAEMNRLPVSAHLGSRVQDVVPQVADLVVPILQRVLYTGDPVRNLEVTTPDPPRGSGQSFRLQCLPLRNVEQAVVGLNVVIEDITEQRLTAERLSTAERRLWLQTEHSPMAVIEWDANYHVTRWGGAAEAMFGWKAEEVLGQPIDRLNIVVEEDWPIVQQAMERMTAADRPYVVSSNRNYTRDRRVITCDWYNSVLTDPDGRLASVLSLVLDVTEQRRAEIEQRLLTGASEVLAEAHDTDRAIARLVRLPIPVFADWCGLETVTPGGRIEPRSFAHLAPEIEADLAPVHRQLLYEWDSRATNIEALKSGKSILRSPVSGLDERSNDARFLELAQALAATSLLAVPLRVEERTLGVWTWGRSRPEPFTPHDLALAEELGRRAATVILNAELFEAIERANRTKDQFLATLGHELRQPLGALTTALALLGKTAASENSERILRVASRQLDLATRLVDDLLDLSRIERGKVMLHRTPLELRRVVKDAVEATGHLVRERQQQLETAMPDSPVSVLGDAARLQQVVSNLLSNASKFSPERETIHLTVEVQGGAARIAVRDNGRGIARSEIDTIFEPFAQAGPKTGGGLGIGLAVVRQLVELHDGAVQAHSEGEGCGSEFVVLLPLAGQAGHDAAPGVRVSHQGRNS